MLFVYLTEDILWSLAQVDGGTYFCRASNDVGSSDELAITFTVRYEPRNIRCAVWFIMRRCAGLLMNEQLRSIPIL